MLLRNLLDSTASGRGNSADKEEQDKEFKFSRDKKQITDSIFNDAIKYFLYEKGEKGEKAELSNNRKTSYNESDYLLKDIKPDF